MTNKELKEKAKEQLGNHVFRNRWITMLAICSVVILADLYLIAVAPFTGFILGPVLGVIIGGPLIFGMTKALRECVDGERWSFLHILHGFTDCFGGSMILGFLQSLFLSLWSVLLIVPGIIKHYEYSMAFYIQCEYTEKEAIDCLDESKAMMKGHKWELFKLDISFFGWYIVGALCLGVGILFVLPYHELARTNFFKQIMTENMEKKIKEALEE